MLTKLLISGGAVALTRIFGVGLGLLVSILIARFMGAEVMGGYAYLTMIITLLSIPAISFGTIMLRNSSKAVAHGGWGETVGQRKCGLLIASIMAVFSIVLCLCLLAIFPDKVSTNSLIAPQFLFYAVFILAGALLFDQLSTFRMNLLRGLDFPVLGQISEMILRPAIICLGVLFLVIFTDNPSFFGLIITVFIAAAISYLIGAVILFIKSPPNLKDSDPIYEPKKWYDSWLPLMTNVLLVRSNGYIDIMMLGFFVTLADIGLYKVASQIGILSGFAYVALNMIASQRFALYLETGEKEALQKTASFLSASAFIFSLVFFVVIYFFGEWLIGLAFGAEFSSILPVVKILILVQLVSSACGMANVLLIMSQKEAQMAKITFLAFILNVLLCCVLIPKYGIIGASWAIFISSSFWNLSFWFFAKVSTGINTSFVGLFR